MLSRPWNRCWLARLATLLVSVALLAMAHADDDTGSATPTSTSTVPATTDAPSTIADGHAADAVNGGAE